MKKIKLLFGYQDTRTNKEDMALTPYIFLVCVNEESKAYGFGLCWFYCSIYVAVGFNIPTIFPTFLYRPYDKS